MFFQILRSEKNKLKSQENRKKYHNFPGKIQNFQYIEKLIQGMQRKSGCYSQSCW